MAKTLIDSLITSFDPTKYQKQVLQMIENKAGNEEIIVTSPYYGDLMSALEASMAAIKGNNKKKTTRKTKSKSA